MTHSLPFHLHLVCILKSISEASSIYKTWGVQKWENSQMYRHCVNFCGLLKYLFRVTAFLLIASLLLVLIWSIISYIHFQPKNLFGAMGLFLRCKSHTFFKSQNYCLWKFLNFSNVWRYNPDWTTSDLWLGWCCSSLFSFSASLFQTEELEESSWN